MKNRYDDPIFTFEGEVLEILCTTKGRYIFTFRDENYPRTLTFMLTASVDHFRDLVKVGERLKLKAQTKMGVATSMMYPGVVEKC